MPHFWSKCAKISPTRCCASTRPARSTKKKPERLLSPFIVLVCLVQLKCSANFPKLQILWKSTTADEWANVPKQTRDPQDVDSQILKWLETFKKGHLMISLDMPCQTLCTANKLVTNLEVFQHCITKV